MDEPIAYMRCREWDVINESSQENSLYHFIIIQPINSGLPSKVSFKRIRAGLLNLNKPTFKDIISVLVQFWESIIQTWRIFDKVSQRQRV